MTHVQSDNPYAAYFKRAARCGETMRWIGAAPPPQLGMGVRDPSDAAIGTVVALVLGEGGAVLAVDVACGLKRNVRRAPMAAMRCYGGVLISLYFRRQFAALPAVDANVRVGEGR